MELELGLALPSNNTRGFDLNIRLPCHHAEVFDEIKPALPLRVSWNNHPEDNDEPNNHQAGGSDSEDENDLVGWPPIQSWRRKHRHYRHNNGDGDGDGDGARPPRSMYVKVKMEGVAIGRKVNINRHHSHLTLTAGVIAMFERYTSSGIGSDGSGTTYVVTYQDREGNWLLVGDVPWQTFIQTVRRLKIQSIAN